MSKQLDPKKKKSLKDFSDQELFYILENNENTDLNILAGICSEVLRRMIIKEKNSNQLSE